ncbi:MAG: DNA polymerase III subunit delta [Patescibacteria group bacterium]|nr:DNA polymerase III subunit delta [Patescibacteria group bacterium]
MLIFFYGENDFKIKQKTQELQDKFIKEIDTSGQNIFKFDGANSKADEILGQIGTGSLFSNKKMVIISDLIKSKQKNILKNLLKYLEKNKINASSDIYIFLEKNIKSKTANNLLKIVSGRETVLNKEEKEFYNFLVRQKYSQEFKNYTQNELSDFIKKEFSAYGLKIAPKEIQLIIALNDNNAWNIYSEIKKIANFKIGQKTDQQISSIDIEKIGSGIFTENIFSFTDAISIKNTKLAMKILEEQYLAGSEPDYILSMLLRQFKILLQIRELLDLNYNSSKITASIKLHPFIISKGINQAKNFEQKTIKRIINELAKMELANRSGRVNVKVALSILISTI